MSRKSKLMDWDTLSEFVILAFRGVEFYTKSDSKTMRDAKLAGTILPTIKPDCDNIAKIVCNALNGLAYADDKQIVECSVQKGMGSAEGGSDH